jgi:beta-lactam-binding protein with PASTA domain
MEERNAIPNPDPVPDVIGMPLDLACKTLRDSSYWGRIQKVERGDPRDRVVLDQDPPPGDRSSAFVGLNVRLTVTGPVDLSELPPGCIKSN